MAKRHDKPEDGKVYCLIGGSDQPSISKGDSWAESEVKPTCVACKATISDERQATTQFCKNCAES